MTLYQPASGDEALKEVAKVDGAWAWCLVQANPRSLPLVAGGVTLDELREHVGSQSVSFGLFRMTFSSKGKLQSRFFFLVVFDEESPTISAVQRGKAFGRLPEMEKVLKGYANVVATVSIEKKSDCHPEHIFKALSSVIHGMDAEDITLDNFKKAEDGHQALQEKKEEAVKKIQAARRGVQTRRTVDKLKSQKSLKTQLSKPLESTEEPAAAVPAEPAAAPPAELAAAPPAEPAASAEPAAPAPAEAKPAESGAPPVQGVPTVVVDEPAGAAPETPGVNVENDIELMIAPRSSIKAAEVEPMSPTAAPATDKEDNLQTVLELEATEPSKSSRNTVTKVEFDMDEMSSRQRRKMKPYKEGDTVEIFSASGQRWMEGEVVQVVKDTFQMAKATQSIQAGSIKVAYNQGCAFKWVAPSQAPDVLRLSDHPKPPPTALASIQLETQGWITNSWSSQYFELNRGFLMWWTKVEDAEKGAKPKGSILTLGLKSEIVDKVVIKLESHATRGKPYGLKFNAEDEVPSWMEALQAHASYCDQVAAWRKAHPVNRKSVPKLVA